MESFWKNANEASANVHLHKRVLGARGKGTTKNETPKEEERNINATILKVRQLFILD